MPNLVDGLVFASLAMVDAWLLNAVVIRLFMTHRLRVVSALIIFWSAVVLSTIGLSTISCLGGYTIWFTVTGLLAIASACARAAVPRKVGTEIEVDTKKENSIWRLRPSAILLGLITAYVFTYGVWQLPVDWDSIAYHLPLVDHWIRDGNLWGRDCAFWYVPGNNETLALFLTSGFSGDYLAQIHNTLPACVLCYCIVEVSSELRLSRWATTLVVLTCVCGQPVLRQIVSAENDIGVVALFLSATLFGWRYARNGQSADVLLLGCSLGILAGIKYYALAYVAAASTITLIGVIAKRGIYRGGVLSISIALGILLLGSFWYWRNWVLTGSPLFPKGILGWPDQWAQMRPGFQHSNLLNSGRSEVWPLLSRAWLTQGGPVSWMAVVFSCLIPLGLVCRTRRVWKTIRENGHDLDVWLCVFVTASLAIYLITPNVVETEQGSLNMLQLQYHPVRFGYSVVVLASLVFASEMRYVFLAQRSHIRDWIRWMLTSAVGLQLIWQLMAVFNFRTIPMALDVYFWWPPPRHQMLGLFVITFLVSVAYLVLVQFVVRRSTRLVKALLMVWVIFAFGCGCEVLSNRWHGEFRDHFGYLLRTNCIVKWDEFKKPDERLCVVDYRYYPFLGSRRENNVCRPLWFANGDQFRMYLDDNSVTVVALPASPDMTHARYQKTRQWFNNQVTKFDYLHVDKKFVLVRMNENVFRKSIDEN